MPERLLIGILGIILGVVVARIFTHLEVSSLKEQLREYEEEHDRLIGENNKLREYNGELHDRFNEVKGVEDKNIPDFDDEW